MRYVMFIGIIVGLVLVCIGLAAGRTETDVVHSGFVKFETEGEYAVFKESLVDNRVNLEKVSAINSGLPIIVQLHNVQLSNGAVFPYGDTQPIGFWDSDVTGVLVTLGLALLGASVVLGVSALLSILEDW